MANQFTLGGSVTFTIGNQTTKGTLGSVVNVNVSGSGFVAENQNMTGSTWTPLITSSLSDVKCGWFYNADVTSSIIIATGSSGQNQLMILQPDSDTVSFAWSGSLPLYAKSVASPLGNNTGSVLLQYALVSS